MATSPEGAEIVVLAVKLRPALVAELHEARDVAQEPGGLGVVHLLELALVAYTSRDVVRGLAEPADVRQLPDTGGLALSRTTEVLRVLKEHAGEVASVRAGHVCGLDRAN